MFSNQQLLFVCGVVGLLLVGLLGWIVYLHMQVTKLKEHYTRLLADAKIPDLQAAWDNHLAAIFRLTKAVAKISEEQLALAHRLSNVIQKVGLLKYDESSETGGRQSFLLALLNEENTGVLINSIHSRASTRVYAKDIKNGLSTHPLTKEEEAAIHVANKNRASK